MEQRITGFHQDDEGVWVAELACGHQQHVRHEPPWQVRPWVATPEGRASRIGIALECRLCDEEKTRYEDARLRGLCHDGAVEAMKLKQGAPKPGRPDS